MGTYCKPFVSNFPTAESSAVIWIRKKDLYSSESKVKGDANAFQRNVAQEQSENLKPSHIVRSQDEVNILAQGRSA